MPCNGHVLPGTPIAVDNFQRREFPHAKLFFLSHYHTDHMVGLSSIWDSPIYTSNITGELLIKMSCIKPSFVKCLEVGEAHLIALDEEGWEKVSVTLFDANHCPGSVMFLFQGYFGNILYTGDFRYVPQLLDFSSLPVIDVLYLDNTYCSPKCAFPDFQTALDSLLNQIHTCLRSSKRIFMGLDNLGKEEILERVVKETHWTIHAPYHRKQILEILGLSHLVTCDEENCKVFMVPTNRISGFNIKKWNEEMPTCAVLATARYCGFNFIPFNKHRQVHLVPLSNHSCYSELMEFVRLVRPKTVVPIIGRDVRGIFNTDISDRANMSVFDQLLNSSPQHEFEIPETVDQYMSVPSVQLPVPTKRKGPRGPQIPKNLPRFMYCDSDESFHGDETESENGVDNVPCPGEVEQRVSHEDNDNDGEVQWEIIHVTARKHV